MTSVLTVLAILAGIYVIVCIIAYLGQRQLIYHPVSHLVSDPEAAGLDYTADTLTAADGSDFLLWRIGEEQNRSILFIYFHGNAENISHNLDRYRLLNSLGAAVWAVEYRGYAGMGKSPSERGIERDLDAVVKRINEKYGDRDGNLSVKIVPYGRSLGGAVAVKLAERITVAGIILESTFSSMHDVARASFPFLPASILLREQYRSDEAIWELSCPKLVMHGVSDEVIPFRLGRKLFEAAGEPKRFRELPDGHNAPLEVSRPVLEPELARFIERIAVR